MTVKLSMVCSKQSNGTYIAICPEVKGCFTQGDSYEEAVANLTELVEITLKEDYSLEYIEDMLMAESKIFSEFVVVV